MNIGLNLLHCTIVLVSFKFYSDKEHKKTMKEILLISSHERRVLVFVSCTIGSTHPVLCYESIIFSWSSGSWVQISSRTHNAHTYLSVKWIRIKGLRLISFNPTSKAQKSARFLASPALKNKYLIDEGRLVQDLPEPDLGYCN